MNSHILTVRDRRHRVITNSLIGGRTVSVRIAALNRIRCGTVSRAAGVRRSVRGSVIGGILALTVTDRRARDLSGNAINVPCSSRVYARNGERDRRH